MTAQKLSALIYSVFAQTDLPRAVVAERANNAAQAIVCLLDEDGRIDREALDSLISPADLEAVRS